MLKDEVHCQAGEGPLPLSLSSFPSGQFYFQYDPIGKNLLEKFLLFFREICLISNMGQMVKEEKEPVSLGIWLCKVSVRIDGGGLCKRP